MSEFQRIGESPRPSTSQDLERRILDLLLEEVHADPGTTVRGVERVSVQAQLIGADVVVLHIDASGLEVDSAADAGGDAAGEDSARLPALVNNTGVDDEAAAVRRRESGMLREATATAIPVWVQGVQVDIEAKAVNVPFEWLELDDGGLALALPEYLSTGSRKGVRLQLRVGINPDDVLAAIMEVVRTELGEGGGISADRENLTLQQLGPRRIRIGFSVRLRWRFLRPTLRARTELHIDNHFVARLLRTRLTSSNPLLAVILRVFRGRIIHELDDTVDLTESFEFLSLQGLRIDAGGKKLKIEVDAGLA